MLKDPAVRTALAGCVGIAAAMGIGRFVYTPILPAMMAGLDLSVSQAGWIASANFVGYLLGAVLGAGRWGQGRERAVAILALVATSLLTAIMGLASDFAVLVVIRFLAGLASAFCMVFLSTIVFGRLAELRREDLVALFFAALGLGISASSIVTGILYMQHVDWRWGWLAAGLLCLVATGLTALWLERAPRKTGAVVHEPPLPRDSSFWGITIAYGIFGAGYIVTATFLIAIVRANGFGPLMESIVWLVTGIAAGPSVYFWDLMARRWGLTITYAVTCVVEAVGVIASVAIPGIAGPLIAGALFGGTFVAITCYGQLAGRLWAGPSPRKAIAVMTAFLGIGQVMGPIGAGYLADWTESFFLPSLLAAVLLLVSGAIGLWSGRGGRDRVAPAKPG